MLRIPKAIVPVMAAALVLTARTQETTSQPSASSTARQNSDSARQKNSELSQEQRNQQSTFQPGQISESQLKKTVTDVNKASSFIGMSVKNMQNENLGKVHDLVFDPESGRISYAVVSIGGVLGVGDKLIAVPVTSLKPRSGEKYLLLNMDKNQVQSAPGLAQNNWPDLNASGIGAPGGAESEKSTGSEKSSGASPSSSSSGQGTGPASTSGTGESTSDKSTSAAPDQSTSPDSASLRSNSDSRKDQ